ncbi:ABC transporter permease [Chelatococcus reniformis]|uniref:ABC transporter permease n=2 Tax=Chelatococcus reniformis TaxID=1494448 RepID=A0A916XPD1_9HYPH|nr:ABC transporter permease [Chelatococcus reniformis]
MSGIFADISGKGSAQAARMAIEDFGGTVLGRPIELLVADHQNKPDIASATAAEWIKDKRIDMITGVAHSAASLAVRELTRGAGVVDIMSSGGSTDLTNKACSPTGFHWSWDSYMLVKSTGEAVVKDGGKSWFFLSTDSAFGVASQREATAVIDQNGGTVKGSVKVRHGLPDMTSFLLQAQNSGSQVVGLAIAGSDFINSVRQASEFGITASGQSLAALVAFITDVHSIGLQNAQGMYISEPFYWDLTDETRAFSERFSKAVGAMPTTIQAGIYSAVFHYLKSVKAAGSTEAKAVAAKIRELPVNDFWTVDARVREDGRVLRPVHLFRVKTPAESKRPWDYYRLVSTLDGAAAARPLADSTCGFIKQD